MPSNIFVIITAYNEAPRIGATLAALAAAFPGAPVWVADDGSTDATALLAREAGARVVRSERVIGKGAAATRAAREALVAAAQAVKDGDDAQAIFILCDGDLGESAGKLG
ncbi:MAG TPA: glycosyltransferase, partial [Solirubrobacteraceae bacterium]|nr:glycosyltransferase [Solirubrobacteraceae bacterium]